MSSLIVVVGAGHDGLVAGYARRALGRWRTPAAGLYVSGAGTNPSGGVLGTPAVPPRTPCSTTTLEPRRRRPGS